MSNDRSHLVPKRIVNKSGVATTVYVNPNEAPTLSASAKSSGKPKPTLTNNSSRIVPSPTFPHRPSVNVETNTGLTVNIVSPSDRDQRPLYALAQVPWDGELLQVGYDDDFMGLYSVDGVEVNEVMSVRQKTEFKYLSRKVREIQDHEDFEDLDLNTQIDDYLIGAAEYIEGLIEEEDRPRTGDNYSSHLISENEDYRLYRPQNNTDTNYRIVDQKTGETYLVDIDEVVGAHEPETVDEDDESFLNLEDLKKLEDMDTIMEHVWKVLPAVD